jgi:hypothetical protein
MSNRNTPTDFSDIAGENVSAFTLTRMGNPVQVFGGRLKWNYFNLLRVWPIRSPQLSAGREER